AYMPNSTPALPPRSATVKRVASEIRQRCRRAFSLSIRISSRPSALIRSRARRAICMGTSFRRWEVENYDALRAAGAAVRLRQPGVGDGVGRRAPGGGHRRVAGGGLHHHPGAPPGGGTPGGGRGTVALPGGGDGAGDYDRG